jgi:hypothetical protein
LLFVSFSRSLSIQIEFVMRAWLFNADFPAVGSGIDPILKFESAVLAGGYLLPPLSNSTQGWSRILLRNWAVGSGSDLLVTAIGGQMGPIDSSYWHGFRGAYISRAHLAELVPRDGAWWWTKTARCATGP